MLELLGRGPVEVDVERHHAALHVAVANRERVAVGLHHRGCEQVQLLEQLGREAIARQREVGELERVGHATDPVDVLDHRELRPDRRAVGVLPGAEHILDHLEHVRIRRQREDEHHLAADARRLDERVLGVVEVLEQVAVEERLALLAEPEHRVQLGARPGRRHLAQELDVAGRHLHVDHEVRAREREEVVDLPRVEHDRVEPEPAGAVVEHGHDERQLQVAVDDLAEHVGGLAAVERRAEHLDLVVPLEVGPDAVRPLVERA